ncbi:hypothetical protein JCM14469_43630 [Desulfatiferula olefinivorans]
MLINTTKIQKIDKNIEAYHSKNLRTLYLKNLYFPIGSSG